MPNFTHKRGKYQFKQKDQLNQVKEWAKVNGIKLGWEFLLPKKGPDGNEIWQVYPISKKTNRSVPKLSDLCHVYVLSRWYRILRVHYGSGWDEGERGDSKCGESYCCHCEEFHCRFFLLVFVNQF